MSPSLKIELAELAPVATNQAISQVAEYREAYWEMLEERSRPAHEPVPPIPPAPGTVWKSYDVYHSS